MGAWSGAGVCVIEPGRKAYMTYIQLACGCTSHTYNAKQCTTPTNAPVGAVEEAEDVPAGARADVVPEALLHQVVRLVFVFWFCFIVWFRGLG